MVQLPEFDEKEILAQASAQLKNWFKTKDNPQITEKRPNETLYHYTDSHGLLGIIKNKELWFTNIYYMSDPSEFRHGLKLATSILSEFTNDENEIVRTSCRIINRAITYDHEKEAFFSLYSASFSNVPDDIGQWRAYADNGKGFSIGISPAFIDEIKENKDSISVFLLNVIYDDKKKEDFMRYIIYKTTTSIRNEKFNKDVKFGHPPDEFNKWVAINLNLVFHIIILSASSKHSAYLNETESRVILMMDTNKHSKRMKIRVRGSELVSFVKQPVDLISVGRLREIVVGPSANIGTERSVRTLLRSEGYADETEVSRSKIPYRSI